MSSRSFKSFTNNDKKLSRKELEVLEAQRRLAATVKKNITAKKVASNKFQNKQQQQGGAKKSSLSGEKKSVLTASAVLAAARSRATTRATPSTARVTRSSLSNLLGRGNLKRPTPPATTKNTKLATSSSLSSDKQNERRNPPTRIDNTESSNNKTHKRPSRNKPLSGISSIIASSKTAETAPKLARKEGSSATFANLIQNVKSASSRQSSANKNDDEFTSSSTNGRAEDAFFNSPESSFSNNVNMEPDDFWKNLHEWNVLLDMMSDEKKIQQQQEQPNKGQQQKQQCDKEACAATQLPTKNNETESSVITKKNAKSLPNTFLNSKHYVAAWAPLVLAETRSQILSEFSSSSNNIGWVCVSTSVTSNNKRNNKLHNTDFRFWEDGDASSAFIKILPERNNKARIAFMMHDLALLVPIVYKDSVLSLMRSHSNNRSKFSEQPPGPAFDWKKCALVGHATHSKKELHGLVLQVSKRKWAAVGQDEMVLIRLGGNVTALREFTALCRVENIPMKRFLLGHHLGPKHQQSSSALIQTSSKKDLLQTMGGSQALGKGFTAYVRKKFNPSQLNAIVASAHEYGEGGFTLIKGPPGTGKTTTLVAVLNSLHIRQYNKYYEEVRRIAALPISGKNFQFSLDMARKAKPRLLVCAPSNAAVDNVILKIIEDGFVDGQGSRYNPSMIRIGIGKSAAVRSVALEEKVDAILSEHMDVSVLDANIERYRIDYQRVIHEMTLLRQRVHAISKASQWPLSRDWEIRIDEETFDKTGRVYFLNHKEKRTTFEVPPPPEPGATHFPATAMPEYRSYISRIVKLVENAFAIKSALERSTLVKSARNAGAHKISVRQSLEAYVMNSVNLTMTTLGTSGGRVLESADKFEVVVVDEAAQSVEPSTLSALNLGSRHCILVGDPQQLPATIFNVSGRNTKYDRSLFQRLEEAGQPVHMLNQQYRMHPKISHFPRHIFYDGNLLDGPNVVQDNYGNPMRQMLSAKVPLFQPFMVLDLDSREERGGTSLSNSAEAQLAVHLYNSLVHITGGLIRKSRVAVITPYSQQTHMLTRYFTESLGPSYNKFIEINTVDAYQGREANLVIFSAVRASGSHGSIGFLSDVRRMNVALTRAKHFLFVIARCSSITVNPYWRDLVNYAYLSNAVLRVPLRSSHSHNNNNNNFKRKKKSLQQYSFGMLSDWMVEGGGQQNNNNRKQQYQEENRFTELVSDNSNNSSNHNNSKNTPMHIMPPDRPRDPRKNTVLPPGRPHDPRMKRKNIS